MKEVCIIFLFVVGLIMKGSPVIAQLSGPPSASINSTQVYSYSNGFVLSPNWRLAEIRGTIVSQTQSGTTYSATIRWNSVGSEVVAFFDGQMPLAQLTVTITEPPPTAPVTVAPSNSTTTTTSFIASWNAVPTATSYLLDVSTVSNFSTFVPGFNNRYVSTNSYTVTSLAGNTIYYYRVRAANTGGPSPNSNVSSIKTAPLAPASLIATNITSDSFLASWAPAWGSSNYLVQVATVSDFSIVLSTVGVSTESALISALSGNTTYYFRVKAMNGALQSGYSGEVMVTTLPAAPGVSYANVTTSSFTANWTVIVGATHYQLQVSTNANFATITTDVTFNGSTSSTVTGLSGGTNYYFKVRAYNSGWTTGFSSIATVLTIPNAPIANNVTHITANSITATWDISPGAANYRLDVSTNSSFSTYVATYQNISVSGTSLNIPGLTSNTPYFYRVRAVNTSGTSANSNVISAHTYTSPPVALPATSITTSKFIANWSPLAGAASYLLEVSLNSGFFPLVYAYNNISVAGTSKEIIASPNTTYYYRVRAVNVTGPSATSNAIIVVTLPSPPQALPSTALTSNSFTANWAVMAGVTNYLLDVSTTSTFTTFVSGYNALAVNGNNRIITGLAAQKTYYYRLRAVNAAGASLYSNTIVGASLDKNFIKTTHITRPSIINQTQINALGILDKATSYDYVDGLGRTMQKVQMQASPAGFDIVQPLAYDEYGREKFKYQPYVTTEVNGFYKPNALGATTYTGSPHQLYYSNGTADKVVDDAKPYSETIFIPSPSNQIVEQGSPGSPWQPDLNHSYTSADRTIKFAQETNVASEVLRWSFTYPTALYPLGIVNTGLAAPVYYAANTLFKNKSKDENHNEIIEFKNNEGKTILKKVQAPAGQWAQTYYIYDGYNNLVCILPPEATARLATEYYQTGATDVTKDVFLKRWAFRYSYDSKKRTTLKQVPGADLVYMVYDNRDRLVLTQDGNQRSLATKYWTFVKYDAFNRPILTGIKDTTVVLSQAAMQAVVNAFYAKAWAKPFETFIGVVPNNIHGYSNKSYPVVTTAATADVNQYVNVTYYDNYNFVSTWPEVYTYFNDALSQTVNGVTYSQPTAENLNVIGQVTGTKTKVLDGGITGGCTWLKAINYFDDRMRNIQIQSDNFKGGRDRVSNVYGFSGKILKAKNTHVEADVTWKDILGTKQEGNKLFRTVSGATWGASGAASVQQLQAGQNGWLEVVVSERNTYRMVGLSDVNADANYATIDYALYQALGVFYIYENGTSRGQFGNCYPGDVLKVERTGTVIRYYLNNALKYTSTVPSSSALIADAAMYDFGSTLINVRASFSTVSKAVTRRFEYDHTGRPLRTWHQMDQQPEVLLCSNVYNELGQVVDKKLHSTVANATDARQSIDYRYNIRGWLSSINNAELAVNATNDDSGDYFGMNLAYHDDLLTGNSTSLQYNGNVSAMKWSVNQGFGSIKAMAFNYTYDPMNRLTAAAHKQAVTLGTWITGQFDENGLSYDLNGNIKSLQRKGDGGIVIDNLVYNYGAAGAASNKLLYVQENATDGVAKWKGLYDGNPGISNDYVYDANGNVTADLNRGISSITYNFLNLPELITKGGNIIRYIYDASGQKLSQVITFGTSVRQTDYAGEFIYENDALQFLNHDEGRVVVSNKQLVYKDRCDNTSNKSSVNAVLASVSINGENYIRATSSGTVVRTGMFPIGGTFPVVAGEKYRIKAKGYRTGANQVHLLIKANNIDLNWPAAGLPASSSAESWMEQTVTIPSGTTTLQAGVVWNTVTAGEIFYLNEFLIEKVSTGIPEYQYHLKDHLGNVRITFTTKDETTQNSATMEDNNLSAEQSTFRNHTRVTNDLFDHTDAAALYNKVHLLNGGHNSQVGLTKSFAVMPGDVITAQVYAKHYGATGSGGNLAGFAAALLSAFGLPAPISGEFGTAAAGMQSYGNFIAGGGNPGNPTWPKGFLNILIFDKNYNLIDLAYQQLEASFVQPVGSVTKTPHQLLSRTKTIKEPGYVYIYLSNEGSVQKDIYFDDLSIAHTKSKVVEANDYYPFGLTFGSYKRENVLEQDYQYNSKELQDELNIGWLDYGARMYDASIARWNRIDPFSDNYESLCPYVYAVNDPVNTVDPDGRLIIFVNGFMYHQWSGQDNRKTVEYRYRADPGVTYTVQNPNYRPYPGERSFAPGAPTYLGQPFSYWGNETNTNAGVGGLFSQAYDDYNTRFISASSDNESQASERFAEGKIAGRTLIKQLDSGEITLTENETIKIVAHSQGGAYAAGMASILAKHKKYSSKLEVVHYLASHQPTDFSHPVNIEGHQWSTASDWVSSRKRSPLMLVNGGSEFGATGGVQNRHYRSHHIGGRGGHSANTYLGALAKYFRSKGISVTVIE